MMFPGRFMLSRLICPRDLRSLEEKKNTESPTTAECVKLFVRDAIAEMLPVADERSVFALFLLALALNLRDSMCALVVSRVVEQPGLACLIVLLLLRVQLS